MLINKLKVSKGFLHVISMLRTATAPSAKMEFFFFEIGNFKA